MPTATEEYILSTLRELSILSEKQDCRTTVVKDSVDSTLYVKKEFASQNGISIHKALSTINHANLPAVKHVFTVDEGFIVVEEYILGTVLRNRLKEGPMPIKQVADIAIQLCDVLSRLHNMTPPIIHRDINPSNIMLTGEGTAKLIDFDAAKEYKPDTIEDTTTLGTKAYAAPEQFGYAKTDARTDIYCIGATMYHMLIGEPYISGSQMPSGKIWKIVKKCLEIDPANRYPNVCELKKDLTKYGKKRGKRIAGVAAGASIVALALFFALYSLLSPLPVPQDVSAEPMPTPETVTAPTPTPTPETAREPTPTAETLPEADISSETEYTTTEFFTMTFSYPSDWRVGEPEFAFQYTLFPTDNPLDGMLLLYREDLSMTIFEADLRFIVNNYIYGMESTEAFVSTDFVEYDLRIAGYYAARIDFSMLNVGVEYQKKTYLIMKDTYIYAVAIGILESSPDDLEDMFNKIVSSIRFDVSQANG